MAEKYKYFDHTADAKFQAYGKTLEEAFANAGLATFNILVEPHKVKSRIKKTISIASRKKESLLYDFLEELLFLMDTEGMVISKIEDLKITAAETGLSLTATVYGDSAKNYELHGSVKQVTYNEMLITEEKGKVVVQVVVDI